MRRLGHAAAVVHAERDHRRIAAIGIDPPDLAARPEDDRTVIGRPGHIGIDAGHRPGFLNVAVEIAVNLAHRAGGQFLDPELGLAILPPHEGDALAIGRGLRTDRAAQPTDRRGRLPTFQIVTQNIEQIGVRILRIFEDRAGRDVLGIVNGIAVRRIDWLAQFLLPLLAGPLDQLHAAAARNMIEPYLPGAERAPRGEMLLRHDILPIGRPAGLVEQTEILVRYLPLVRAIGVHNPDIVTPAPIRGEGDAAAVGGKARLYFPGQAFGYARRRAAAHRHGVDIAEQRKSDGTAIRAHIDIDPAALVHIDGGLAELKARRAGNIPIIAGGSVTRYALRGDRCRRLAGLRQLPGILIIVLAGDDLVFRRLGLFEWRGRPIFLGKGGGNEKRGENAGQRIVQNNSPCDIWPAP